MKSGIHYSFDLSEEKRRILVVEDEPVNQEILKMLIGDTYEVLSAYNGQEAMELIRARHKTLSLVLLDLNLPDLHGLEVLRRMKGDPVLAGLPVIVMTADSEAEVESLTLGAIDFIPKPYPQQKVVLARILRTIELSENRDILRWTERDHLTGLYNKEFFYHHAAQLDLYHKNASADAIFLNINRFHTINDRYGKSVGDEILRRLAGSVRESVRENGGIVCRSEADSFLIYCPHRSDYGEILNRAGISIPGDGKGESRIRIRMGVYADVDKTLDLERRFDRAKMAAETVRGQFASAIGMYSNAMRDAELLSDQLMEDFPAAIAEKQFRVYYQPKFDVRPNKPVLVSAEALVRWNHPALGMISPCVFVPLFEHNGLIRALDQYVWAEAAAQVRRWKEQLDIALPVSVNVSRVDLLDPSLVENLKSLLTANGLSSRELLLEITESAYTEDSNQMIETVCELRKTGFRIEMDDFGSGYSSLSMLSSLPIDALKLDMQFIRSAFREQKDTRLLEAMIQLADRFDVPTIAEGVETEEQMITLKIMGCDVIQGYYFSRPLPSEEFEVFLKEKRNAFRPSGPEESGTDRDEPDSLHDPLTGLYNKNAFEILLQGVAHKQVTVLSAEVDHYAEIQHEHGREYADRVIRHVAGVLRKNFRRMDCIVRLREDKFVILMIHSGSTDRNRISSKIDRINEELREMPGELIPVALSVGVAFSDTDKTGGAVFRDADVALERRKEIRTKVLNRFLQE